MSALVYAPLPPAALQWQQPTQGSLMRSAPSRALDSTQPQEDKQGDASGTSLMHKHATPAQQQQQPQPHLSHSDLCSPAAAAASLPMLTSPTPSSTHAPILPVMAHAVDADAASNTFASPPSQAPPHQDAHAAPSHPGPVDRLAMGSSSAPAPAPEESEEPSNLLSPERLRFIQQTTHARVPGGMARMQQQAQQQQQGQHTHQHPHPSPLLSPLVHHSSPSNTALRGPFNLPPSAHMGMGVSSAVPLLLQHRCMQQRAVGSIGSSGHGSLYSHHPPPHPSAPLSYVPSQLLLNGGFSLNSPTFMASHSPPCQGSQAARMRTASHMFAIHPPAHGHTSASSAAAAHASTASTSPDGSSRSPSSSSAHSSPSTLAGVPLRASMQSMRMLPPAILASAVSASGSGAWTGMRKRARDMEPEEDEQQQHQEEEQADGGQGWKKVHAPHASPRGAPRLPPSQQQQPHPRQLAAHSSSRRSPATVMATIVGGGGSGGGRSRSTSRAARPDDDEDYQCSHAASSDDEEMGEGEEEVRGGAGGSEEGSTYSDGSDRPTKRRQGSKAASKRSPVQRKGAVAAPSIPRVASQSSIKSTGSSSHSDFAHLHLAAASGHVEEGEYEEGAHSHSHSHSHAPDFSLDFHPHALQHLKPVHPPACPAIADAQGLFACHMQGCGRKFTRNSNLTRHLRIHEDVKRFKCKQCPKKFMEKHHLEAHMRVHTGIRPFACPRCSRTFTDRSNCSRHIRTHGVAAARLSPLTAPEDEPTRGPHAKPKGERLKRIQEAMAQGQAHAANGARRALTFDTRAAAQQRPTHAAPHASPAAGSSSPRIGASTTASSASASTSPPSATRQSVRVKKTRSAGPDMVERWGSDQESEEVQQQRVEEDDRMEGAAGLVKGEQRRSDDRTDGHADSGAPRSLPLLVSPPFTPSGRVPSALYADEEVQLQLDVPATASSSSSPRVKADVGSSVSSPSSSAASPSSPTLASAVRGNGSSKRMQARVYAPMQQQSQQQPSKQAHSREGAAGASRAAPSHKRQRIDSDPHVRHAFSASAGSSAAASSCSSRESESPALYALLMATDRLTTQG